MGLLVKISFLLLNSRLFLGDVKMNKIQSKSSNRNFFSINEKHIKQLGIQIRFYQFSGALRPRRKTMFRRVNLVVTSMTGQSATCVNDAQI